MADKTYNLKNYYNSKMTTITNKFKKRLDISLVVRMRLTKSVELNFTKYFITNNNKGDIILI